MPVLLDGECEINSFPHKTSTKYDRSKFSSYFRISLAKEACYQDILESITHTFQIKVKTTLISLTSYVFGNSEFIEPFSYRLL